MTGIDEVANDLFAEKKAEATTKKPSKPPKSPRSGEPRSHVKNSKDIWKGAADKMRAKKADDAHKKKQNRVDLRRGVDL